MFCPNCGKNCGESNCCSNSSQNLRPLRQITDDELMDYIEEIERENDSQSQDAKNKTSDDFSVEEFLDGIDLSSPEDSKYSDRKDDTSLSCAAICCPKCRSQRCGVRSRKLHLYLYNNLFLKSLALALNVLSVYKNRRYKYVCYTCGHIW